MASVAPSVDAGAEVPPPPDDLGDGPVIPSEGLRDPGQW